MKKFPVVRASGTNYEVGRAIGESRGGVIKAFLIKNRQIFGSRLPGYLRQSIGFQKQALKYFPKHMDELRGIADGAGVSFAELFLSNNREVVDFGIHQPGHCTIIGIPHRGGYLLGHNEDWDKESLALLYILDATIAGTRIFGLNYANNIIGASVAVNGYGLAEAVNELYHQDAQMGVPKNFIARAMLDCKTLEKTEELMRRVPRAAGFNHVLVQADRLWNIESSAKEYVIQKISDLKYVHTNHYLTRLAHTNLGRKESEIRYRKVKKGLSQIKTISDIKAVLSDRREPPVCRAGTIGSVIIDFSQAVTYVACGQPEVNNYYAYNFNS